MSTPYTWDQTLKEVTITVPVPSGVRARDLVITIRSTSLLVKLKSASEAIIDVCNHTHLYTSELHWSSITSHKHTHTHTHTRTHTHTEREREGVSDTI
jgi:hypothetical protein